jgi:uncharacterized protein (UPF0332 family)
LTAIEKQHALSRYRIKQAEESLDEAKYLSAGKKSPRSIINRAYYAMFYAVLALLVYEQYSSSKHSGILSYFNRRFIKEKVFDESIGRSLNKAFDLRQRGDYRENIDLTYEQVEPFISEAENFIQTVKAHLERALWG